MTARAFATGVALFGLAACDAVRPTGNPLLQTREGRREVVSLCHDAVQERIANVDSLRFARGEIINSGEFGGATYYGAVEGVASGNVRRYSFICGVQPSGALELVFR